MDDDEDVYDFWCKGLPSSDESESSIGENDDEFEEGSEEGSGDGESDTGSEIRVNCVRIYRVELERDCVFLFVFFFFSLIERMV